MTKKDTGNRIQEHGSTLIMVTGCWMLATGFWLLDAGHWILATRYWFLFRPYRAKKRYNG
ncbi:MAG: hypothetical protein JXL67_06050 [Calditrichaeota bacterium]|nr:hypothetical protein [Calditrichota bacterium]